MEVDDERAVLRLFDRPSLWRAEAAASLGLTGRALAAAVSFAAADRVAAADKLVVTAGCNEPGGETFAVQLAPRGSKAFVVDADGERTGETLHLLSVDLAGFTNPGGQLAFEQHMTWGNRNGQTDLIFCAGSFIPEPGVIVFFDALATRR